MRYIVLSSPGPQATVLVDLLMAMGCDGGQAARANLCRLNQSILRTLQRTWYNALHIPFQRLDPDRSAEFGKQAIAAIEAAERAGCCVHADSALPPLLPLWREWLIEPVYVLFNQHPVAVAWSLQQRWRFPIVFGAALWELYMRSAVEHTKGSARVIVSHEKLIRQPVETANEFRRALTRLKNERPAKLGRSRVNTIVSPEWFDDTDMDRNADFLSDEQLRLYDQLLNEDLDSIECGMSEVAEDILNAYGRLRAGYEHIKRERDEVLDNLQKLSEESTSPERETASIREVASDPQSRKRGLIKVDIHLRDMGPLGFYSEPDNPILSTLFEVLKSRRGTEHNGDPLIYIHYDEEGSQMLYFPVSQLVAVETSEPLGNPPLSVEPTGTNEEIHVPGPAFIQADPAQAKIAVVVLACLLPKFDRAIEMQRQTWGSHKEPNVDIFYAYGTYREDDDIERADISKYTGGQPPSPGSFGVVHINDVIICGCSDTIYDQQDCLLRKRLIAFDYLINKHDYDLIYTVCASSYVDQRELKSYVSGTTPARLFHGPVGLCHSTNLPYVSGASMLMSRDIVELLAKYKHHIVRSNDSAYADDVALGSWISEHVCKQPRQGIIENIKQGRKATDDNLFVMPGRRALVNYVSTEPEFQTKVDGAYHYHFDSNRPDDMNRFHQKYFAEP